MMHEQRQCRGLLELLQRVLSGPAVGRIRLAHPAARLGPPKQILPSVATARAETSQHETQTGISCTLSESARGEFGHVAHPGLGLHVGKNQPERFLHFITVESVGLALPLLEFRKQGLDPFLSCFRAFGHKKMRHIPGVPTCSQGHEATGRATRSTARSTETL